MFRKFLFVLALLGMAGTVNAQTYSQHRYWVRETYTVKVHPSPVWTSAGWIVPTPYDEQRTRLVEKMEWVEVQPLPRIVSPPIYVIPPVYVYPCPTYWYIR